MECLILKILVGVLFSGLPLSFATCTICNNTYGNYTRDLYYKNLQNIPQNITSNTQIEYGFYNFSVGQNSDEVYVIGVCRFDLTVADCRSCLIDAANQLLLQCTAQKEAILYSDQGRCTLRYSDRPIFGIIGDNPSCPLPLDNYTPSTCANNSIRATINDGNSLNPTVQSLLHNLTQKTAAANSHHKFANGTANVSDTLQIYALTQCTPDLSSSDCSKCLQGQINQLPSCYNFTAGQKGGIYGPSCIVELENNQFINSAGASSSQPPPPPPPPPSSSSAPTGSPSENRRWKSKVWIFIVVMLGVGMLLATLGFFFLRRRKKKMQKEGNDEIKCIDSLEFDYDIIKEATKNFSDANRLGNGTSASIYKGILSNGQEIAVKKLVKNRRESEVQFNNEIMLLANLQHRNLVKLLGFCNNKNVRLLVYEFVLNESLYWFLHDPVKCAQLDWETRRKIIMGIARGLVYLHEDSQLMVIHRDLKASKILLDAEMNPKISNFSKASRVHADEPWRTDVSKVKGTYGYMAPEYVQQGHSSQMSDVFSYGVLLLEIINGQMISNFAYGENEDNLLSFVNMEEMVRRGSVRCCR